MTMHLDIDLQKPHLECMKELFHKEAESNLEAKERDCLKCGERFSSEWAGDRVCGRCKGSIAWRTG